ncbi:MAG TPA: MFS transporter [Chloroflexaceae bacterium]|mgnify:CR=1 FL=1|nr:MFS transporter [Chloroflexaceae bacterium]
MDTLARAARRITGVLFVSQSMASAAFIAAITVIPIVGAELSGQPELAGLPSTVQLAGAAAAAYPAGRLMQRFGRRPGLAAGFLLGLVGALIATAAIVAGSFLLFLAGLLLYGFARGITDQSRYAAADAVPLSRRARAISMVVFAGTVGAVGGPALVGPLGLLAEGWGLPALAGPMLGGALLFAAGGALVALLLRPDPRELARRLAAEEPVDLAAPSPVGPGRGLGEVLGEALPRLALAAMVTGQAVMVLVMSVTSLHMHNHDHGLGNISLVIGAHTLGMFGLSVVTGGLADRLGRPATIALGALLLIGGALLAPVSLLTPWLALALFLVGLGWNLCYIGGSTLLSDALTPAERGRVQGASDLLINLASAGGSLGSGLILARLGYGPLCLIGAALSLLPLVMAIPRMARGAAEVRA